MGAVDRGASRNRRASALRVTLATLAALLVLAGGARAATITVTSTADDLTPNDGTVSLREAIIAIDNGSNLGDPDISAQAPGTFGLNDTIKFHTGARHTIDVGSTGLGTLPSLTKPMTINGYTQPGASANALAAGDNAAVLITIDGASAGPDANGLLVAAGAGGSTIEGLDIFDFTSNQLELQANGNVVAGNDLGYDTTGAPTRSPTGLMVSHSSFNLIGGTTPASRNLISGNLDSGIDIVGTTGSPATQNLVEGNFIGTDPSGMAADGNARFAPALGAIGAVQLSGADLNTIGGVSAADRNVISGNGGGVDLRNGAQNDAVEGNFIGVAADGASPLPNLSFGVHIGSDDNLSPPAGPGQTKEPATESNSVGLDPNRGFTGIGNVIAFNGGDGVLIQGTPQNNVTQAENSGNSILGNSIYSNGGLGIDLQEISPNPKPNNLLAAPTITSVITGGSSTIHGTLSLPSSPKMTLRIELFASAKCDSSGFGQGQTLIGVVSSTTDSAGNAAFTDTLPPLSPGEGVTATATNTTSDPSTPPGSLAVNNTSEFSRCAVVPPPAKPSPPSNKFTVVSTSVHRGLCTLKVSTQAPGRLSAIATFVETIRRTTGHRRHRHTHLVHKTITYAEATTPAAVGALTTLLLVPKAAASKLLTTLHLLKLSIRVSFIPSGGTASSVLVHVTVRAPKHKHRHRR